MKIILSEKMVWSCYNALFFKRATIAILKKKGKFYLLERLLELIFWVYSPKNDFG